jgi:peptidoglycan/LPS O-acetylase OafA/YrhL/lysophospholipase L1-like esterase
MTHRGVRYMPALDGLRGLAVVAVLLYHGDVSWAKGGYFGVDAFFVLSGFLITSLLLAERRDTGHIDLKAFWTRRARRLLPALALVLVAVAVYAARAATPIELSQLRRDALSTMAYVANWNQIFSHQSYFQKFAAPSALKHTWSLAIEEQFYLVWPLVVFAALRWKRMTRTKMLVGIGGLAAASATWMAVLYHPGQDPSRVYYGTDTRAQSLLIGAFLAALLSGRDFTVTWRQRRVLHAAALASVAILAFVWATTTDSAGWQYRGGFAFTAILVAIIIAGVTHIGDNGALGSALSSAPLRAVGLISYGLYLWHWPIYVYLSPDRTGLPHLQLLLLRLGVSFAVATISFVLIERPIRRGAFHGWQVRFGTPVVAGVLAVTLLAATARPLPPEFQAISASSIKPPTVTAAAVTTHHPLRVMLVGDSVAASMAPGLAAQANARGFVFWSAAVPGCGLATDVGERYIDGWEGIDPRCVPGWRTRWPLQVAAFKPDIVVMLVGGQDMFDRRINGQVTRFDTAAGATLAESDEATAVKLLSARGARVVVLTTPYYVLGWPQRVVVNRSPLYKPWTDMYNGYQRAVAKNGGGKVAILDLNRLLDPNGVWTDTVDGIQVRTFDKCHLSTAGANFVAKWLSPQLAKLAPQPTNPISGGHGLVAATIATPQALPHP